MAEQPVNLATALYLGVFSRAEQRVLLATKIAISAGMDSLAGGDYLIHIKSEGRAGRDYFPLGFDSYFAAANLICIKSDGQILDPTARFLDPS